MHVSDVSTLPPAALFIFFVSMFVAGAEPQERADNLLTGSFAVIEPSADHVAMKDLDAASTPAGKGIRLDVAKATDPYYKVQISQNVPVEIPEGMKVRLRFWARSSSGNPMRALIERNREPWDAIIQDSPILAKEWKDYTLTGTARETFKADGLAVRFQVGHRTGDVELAGIAVEKIGMDELFLAAGPALEAAAVEKRIDELRKGDLTIQVKDEQGRALAGAEVKVEQVRHAFLFGCNIFALQPNGREQWQKEYQQRFEELLNFATLPFYWGSFEPQKGKPQYAKLDAMAKWCMEHGITPKGHPLVWHEVYPGWAPKTADDAIPVLRQRAFDILDHYKDTVRVWDVVNEANNAADFDNGEGAWAKRDGAASLVQTSLAWAREKTQDRAASHTLLYNDFNITDKNLALLAELKKRNALPDAVGIQSHMHGGTWAPRQVWIVAEQFGGFGRPVHFTEVTVLSGPAPRETDGSKGGTATTPEGEQAQADYVEELYTILFSHPAVRAITWWDFSDRDAWQKAPAGLLRKDMTPKPAYDRLMGLIRGKWWTSSETESDDAGKCRVRAFYGSYKVTVADGGGRTVTQAVEFPHGEKQRTITVTLK